MTHNESLLHYVWKHKLYNPTSLSTSDGNSIEIIDPGIHNTDAGPDFFNAKIKIDDKVWAGNVEIHRDANDWKKHKHHIDKAYNSVILHVVENANKETVNEKGEYVPQCQLIVSDHVRENATYLLHSDSRVACRNHLPNIPPLIVNSFLSVLSLERLERKTDDIFAHLERFNNSWDEAFYVMLTRNFGFGLNSDAFERLALSLSYKYIQKHSDSLYQVEALIFGQAGLLEDNISNDDYYVQLQQEYRFLKNKYLLKNLDGFLFKNMRVRPQSFPLVRLAQLAALLQKSGRLFSVMLEKEDFQGLRLHFQAEPSEYWQTHYTFGKESKKSVKLLGDTSLNMLLINTIAPILFAYGKKTASEKYCDRAIHILESIKPESNSIVNEFKYSGINPKHAFDTQAIIQLRKEYCDKRKCLYCRIGHALLSRK
ncbi:MAG: DUF2851 family protein [Dysgonamonadaceae bacterium]|jgi:hypothetical protein|nr:DUF2851 family protein [Dysgonamonadaceae bacterium]